ncbi:MAG: hypothetical protein AB1513_04350 [Pseudomonadota bacterium]
MIGEHKAIRATVEKLRLAAHTEHATKYGRLTEQLALHAQTEEEALYLAAVLVGDPIRARMQWPHTPTPPYPKLEAHPCRGYWELPQSRVKWRLFQPQP